MRTLSIKPGTRKTARALGWRAACFALFIALALADRATAAPKRVISQEQWVGTWAASPMRVNNKENLLNDDTTLRQIVHVSLGGSTVRIVFSNEFAADGDSLLIGGANVAPNAGAGAIDPALAKTLTFGGKTEVVIPPGALAFSDPVSIQMPALTDLVVTMFLPKQSISILSAHTNAEQTNYAASGNQLLAPTLRDSHKFYQWIALKDVAVMAGPDAGAIVALGDSITDGAYSTGSTNNRWPDILARRLRTNPRTTNLGVLNQGIGGNRLLHNGTGEKALARLDRDVLAQAGVRYLILLEGINDIGEPIKAHRPEEAVSAEQLIAALNQIIDRAHARGIKVIGATLTPYQGAGYYTEDGEKIREAENDFIRKSGRFDGVIDFEKMMQDPSNLLQFLPAYNGDEKHKPDHLHPNDAGYKAMGSGADLKLFER